MSVSASQMEFRTLERALPYSPTRRLANGFPCHAHHLAGFIALFLWDAHLVQTGI
jgi:hypothetical protein